MLETTFEQAASDPSGEAPEEMVSELEETVREFESSQAGVLPRRMQRALFVYFCGLLVIVALMQASFTSDTTDEVLGKGAELAPYEPAVGGHGLFRPLPHQVGAFHAGKFKTGPAVTCGIA
ncbi:hypothetical protein AB0H94_34770 [Streptomyces purpurascens]|uniref:hypothetical protein n=1 Tax=Streptomyces purpurascens TaxID=1924 RepID=UPI0034104B9A